MKISRQLTWVSLLLIVVVTACSTAPPRELFDRKDHSALATWYEQEAVRLRGKAAEMQQMTERYAAFSAPHLSPKETRRNIR
jgi:hypothetical protein